MANKAYSFHGNIEKMAPYKGGIEEKSHNSPTTLQTATKEGKTLNCKICHRKAVTEEFCQIHLKAYENIVENYDCWRKALKISWIEYLSEIEQNPLTGEWAKEVASYLISNEEIRNVEES